MKLKLKIIIIINWLLRITILLILIEIVHFAILVNPEIFFEHNINYRRYTIFSDASITWEVLKTFDEVEERIIATEIFDSLFSPKIFICFSQKPYSFFTFLLGVNSNSSGVNVSLLENTFINMNKVGYLKMKYGRKIKHSHLVGELSQIIAHELIHNLSQKKIGWSAYRILPRWKREGYAEYGSVISQIGSDKNFEGLFERSKIYFEEDLFNEPMHSKEYYKFQLLVEYLFKVEKNSFDEFIKNTNSEKSVFNNFQNWYKRTKNKTIN